MKLNPWRAIPVAALIVCCFVTITLLGWWRHVGWTFLVFAGVVTIFAVFDWWENKADRWDMNNRGKSNDAVI